VQQAAAQAPRRRAQGLARLLARLPGGAERARAALEALDACRTPGGWTAPPPPPAAAALYGADLATGPGGSTAERAPFGAQVAAPQAGSAGLAGADDPFGTRQLGTPPLALPGACDWLPGDARARCPALEAAGCDASASPDVRDIGPVRLVRGYAAAYAARVPGSGAGRGGVQPTIRS
jgi:hypothetical protein